MNYEYRCISAQTHFQAGVDIGRGAANVMSSTLHAQNAEGFEYMGTFMVGTTESPGCLAALFGARTLYREIPIMVFRRPIQR